jgi:YidC/Oxa1 family membrane protein insertase
MGFFTVTIYQPLYNLLVWLYNVLPGADIGIAIIVLTILIKGLLFPLTFKQLKSQKEMQEIQPLIKEIQAKYKDDKEKLAQELMGVYKEHNVNPFASCLPLIVQLPIFIGLFQVLRNGFGEVNGDILYSFVANPGMIDPMFLGLIDLSTVFFPLVILASIAQYFQMKFTIGRRVDKSVRKESGAMDEDMTARMNKSMMYMMPVVTLIIGTTLPAGLMLYWLATTLLTIALYAIFLGEKSGGAGSGSAGKVLEKK